MLLNDRDIRSLCILESTTKILTGMDKPMIEPFSEAVSGGGVISYGLTAGGYDLRLAPSIWFFKNTSGRVVDPKAFNDLEYQEIIFDKMNFPAHSKVILPSHSYVLGKSFEYLRIPRHLKARVVGKSTLARSGIIINTTPLEPGWEGHLTIEIANSNPSPACIYSGEGIGQLEFELLTYPPEIDYAQKGGRYQGQMDVTPPIMR